MRREPGALGLLVAALVVAGTASVQAGNKVKVCHVPPGNPDNFHTITVSENALQAHLGHGDLSGSCFANAEALCDDGDACTIDGMDPETETCLADHPAVDCSDGLLCTTDSCDSTDGCQYAPIACDDGDNCTVDTCNPADGECMGTPIDCGALGLCVAETGQCDYPCDGITCDPIDQCHTAGECVLPGVCVEGAALPDGTACDDGDAGTDNDQCSAGVCVGEATSCAQKDKCTVFVTSQVFNGNLGGLAGADAKCQTAAANAGLPGTFKAWLSDHATSARDRFVQANVPYVTTEGVTVANSFADLTDGSNLAAPIAANEFGENPPYPCSTVPDAPGNCTDLRFLRTGTDRFGVRNGDTCNLGYAPYDAEYDWKAAGANRNGLVGSWFNTDPTWTQWFGLYCSTEVGLICFEQ